MANAETNADVRVGFVIPKKAPDAGETSEAQGGEGIGSRLRINHPRARLGFHSLFSGGEQNQPAKYCVTEHGDPPNHTSRSPPIHLLAPSLKRIGTAICSRSLSRHSYGRYGSRWNFKLPLEKSLL